MRSRTGTYVPVLLLYIIYELLLACRQVKKASQL